MSGPAQHTQHVILNHESPALTLEGALATGAATIAAHEYGPQVVPPDSWFQEDAGLLDNPLVVKLLSSNPGLSKRGFVLVQVAVSRTLVFITRRRRLIDVKPF